METKPMRLWALQNEHLSFGISQLPLWKIPKPGKRGKASDSCVADMHNTFWNFKSEFERIDVSEQGRSCLTQTSAFSSWKVLLLL